MYSIGNTDLLHANPIAIYCSRNVPPTLYSPALELMEALMESSATLAGGWQSKLEKAALKTRLPGAPSKIIFFLAKGVYDFKIPAALQEGIDAGHILLAAPFMKNARIDKKKVAQRDELIFSLIHRFLFLNIDAGGSLDNLFDRCLKREKDVFLLDHFSNYGWAIENVELVSPGNLKKLK